MNCNVVPLDRGIRVGAGLFLLATPILNLPTYPYNLIGIVPIVTGLVGFCPLYAAVRSLFGAKSDAPKAGSGRHAHGHA
jgi:hypothetical protein